MVQFSKAIWKLDMFFDGEKIYYGPLKSTMLILREDQQNQSIKKQWQNSGFKWPVVFKFSDYYPMYQMCGIQMLSSRITTVLIFPTLCENTSTVPFFKSKLSIV